MKKIILSLAVLALLVVSCNLDEEPKGVIPRDNAIKTVEDAEGWMRYEYIYMRAYSAGSYVYRTEIASDFFNPVLDYGNRQGDAYRWDWNSGSEFTDLWAGAYSGINHACFVIETVENMDKSEFDSDELKRLNKVLGVAHFTKAYLGLKLLEYYAPVYNSSNAGKYGIMLVDLHRPTGDINSYPGRSTVAESYEWVKTELEQAGTYLASYAGTPGADEITVDVVNAFKARLALYMGDYDKAISLSTALVDGGKYPLCETAAEMKNLWTNDSGQECILQLFSDANSTPSTLDPTYYGLSAGKYRPDWIINKWVASTLYNPTDLRFQTWFQTGVTVTVSIGTASGMTLMNKFPGNSALATSETAHLQKIKPFRIAEQYLIAAEAFARKGGADAVACQYLDELGTKRDPSYINVTLTGDALIEYIKDEWAREFIGEGYRWFCLKRWGDGMQRTAPQLAALVHTGGSNAAALLMNVTASDYHWLEPIPADEISSNPQIREQQNPGY